MAVSQKYWMQFCSFFNSICVKYHLSDLFSRSNIPISILSSLLCFQMICFHCVMLAFPGEVWTNVFTSIRHWAHITLRITQKYRSVRKRVHFNKVLTISYSKDYMEVQLNKTVSLLGSFTKNERSWRIVSNLEITPSPKIWPHQGGRPHGSWSPPPSYLSTSSVLLNLPRFLKAMSIERRWLTSH